MAVTRDGTVLYSPKLTEHRPEEVAFIILHELFHILYEHFKRGEGKENDPLWRLSEEIEINDVEVREPVVKPKNIPVPEDYSLPSHKTAEWYYERLQNSSFIKRKALRDAQKLPPCLLPPEETDETVRWEREQRLSGAVQQVISQFGRKDIGYLPETLGQFVLNEVIKRKEGRIYRWLLRFIGQCVGQEGRWDFLRPNRRFSTVPSPPKFTMKFPKFGVVIDVSSSISHKELELFLSVVSDLVSKFRGELDVYTANVDVVEKWEGGPFRVGGGTNLKNALKNLTDKEVFTGIIVFTDGYTETPTRTEVKNTPILWVLSEENESFRPQWGDTFVLKED